MNALYQALYKKSSAHYYTLGGEARYEIMKVDGSGTRAPTVKDAREHGWLPSVTTILQMWPKPELFNWKRQQDIMAALTLPRKPGEGDTEFCERLVKDADEVRSTAATKGLHIHALFEAALNEQLPIDGPANEWWPFIQAWVKRTITRVFWTEKIIVDSRRGYAARGDALVTFAGLQTPILCDFKSQNIRKGVVYYDEWAMQLEAEFRALSRNGDLPRANCASIVVDSQTPSEPIYLLWGEVELHRAWERFRACFELWKLVKDYDPTPALKEGNSGGSGGT